MKKAKWVALLLVLALCVGMLAGCGILLPYIGPVAGCLLTLLVTFAFGDAIAKA